VSKVLHCIASLGVGGVETCVLDMFAHFARTGSRHRHALCAFRGGKLESTRLGTLRDAGMECHVLSRPSRYSLAFCRSLRRTIAQVQPDIIQAYNPTAALWTRLLRSRRSSTPIIVHCGGVGGLTRRARAVERWLVPRTAAFIFNSRSTQAIWEGFLSINCERRVIYNGVTLGDLDDTNPPSSLPESPFVLLTVCRIVPVKSLATQIDAVKILHDRGHQNVRLVIVGDGPIRAQLEDHARDAGIDNAISFEGFQPQPRMFHQKAHVYLCTSYNETFGMTLAEAMFDRMVVIAAAVGGPSEIIQDGQNGFLLPCSKQPPADLLTNLPTGQALPTSVYDATIDSLRPPMGVRPEQLADKIIEVRGRYTDLQPLREAARQRIVDQFSVARYCDRLENLYDEFDAQQS